MPGLAALRDSVIDSGADVGGVGGEIAAFGPAGELGEDGGALTPGGMEGAARIELLEQRLKRAKDQLVVREADAEARANKKKKKEEKEDRADKADAMVKKTVATQILENAAKRQQEEDSRAERKRKKEARMGHKRSEYAGKVRRAGRCTLRSARAARARRCAGCAPSCTTRSATPRRLR